MNMPAMLLKRSAFRNKPIKEMKGAFIAACVRANVGQRDDKNAYSGFTWDGLRHTWATWHVQSGTPLEVLEKLSDWSDLRMVMNYAHQAPGRQMNFVTTQCLHYALACDNF